jgi:hypothetical protein
MLGGGLDAASAYLQDNQSMQGIPEDLNEGGDTTNDGF